MSSSSSSVISSASSSRPIRNISTNDLMEPPSTKTNVMITQHAYSSLFESVSQSNLEETRGHLDNGQSPRATNSSGDTPLHIASKTGSIDIVRILLEYGANPNSINSGGMTPLHQAVKHEYSEVVKILLTFGADSNITEFEKGKTSLHFAAENKNREIYDLLLKFNANVGIQDKFGNFPMIRVSLHQSIRFDDDYKGPCVCDSCKLL